MSKVLEERLRSAIGTGELVNIIYHGGSEPGSSRMIMPIAFKGEKIRAKCYKTDQVKEFYVDKITFAVGDTSSYTGLRKTPDYDFLEGIATIQDLLNRYQYELVELGWTINHSETYIGLYKSYKNGKIYKRPTIIIEADNLNFPERPWYCEERRYKYLSKATTKFMKAAKERAPNRVSI
jgi:hypothetical protein